MHRTASFPVSVLFSYTDFLPSPYHLFLLLCFSQYKHFLYHGFPHSNVYFRSPASVPCPDTYSAYPDCTNPQWIYYHLSEPSWYVLHGHSSAHIPSHLFQGYFLSGSDNPYIHGFEPFSTALSTILRSAFSDICFSF